MNLKFNKSKIFFNRALKVIPLASQTFSKSYYQYPKNFSPLFINRGLGSKVWDIDNNQYIDLVSGLLPIILGYQDSDVNSAIINQLKSGIIFSMPSTLETDLAELLVELIPCAQKVRFGKNGSDATSAAVRLARAYTSRDIIIRIGYHGWQDWYIGSTSRYLGVPKAVRNLTLSCNYNDLNQLHNLIKFNKDNVAAIIMEPMTFEEPINGYLENIRKICDSKKIILIFDEIITGFRFDIGGAQRMFKVIPDLATFGKAMANGMPISAVVGKAKIMNKMDEIFFSTTFGGETLSLAASLATIKKIINNNVISNIWNKGENLKNKLMKIIGLYDLNSCITLKGKAPWFVIDFKDINSFSKLQLKTFYIKKMIENGILTNGTHNLSYSHTSEDIEEIVNVYKKILPIIKQKIDDKTLLKDIQSDIIKPIFSVR